MTGPESGPVRDGLTPNLGQDNPDPPPRAVFSVADLPPAQRFEAWRESIACIFEVDPREPDPDTAFHAEVDASMFGNVMLARTSTRAQEWRRTPLVIGQDGMDHYMVQFFLDGGQAMGVDNVDRECEPGSVVIYDLAREVTTRTSDFTNLSLIVPRDQLAPQLRSGDDQHGRVLSASDPMASLLKDHIKSLEGIARKLTAEQAKDLGPATAGLVAACLNGAVGDHPGQQEGARMAQFTIIKRLIEKNLSRPDLSVDWIARQAGISRSKLYTLFGNQGGIANYIRDRRLRWALAMLADRRNHHVPIYSLALSCGYSSDTAFSRAFRKRFGISPTDIRQGRSRTVTNGEDPNSLDRRYEDWIQDLAT
jgi:AraC-like DNA-binding protein